MLLSCTGFLLRVQNLGKFSAPDVFEGQFISRISVVKAIAEDAESLNSLPSSEEEVDLPFLNIVT